MKGFTLGFLVALTALPVMAATVPSRLLPNNSTENNNSAPATVSRTVPTNTSSETVSARK